MQTEAKHTSKAGLAQGAQERRICTLVLGMHRSGTSALVRTLNLMGAALPSQIVAPSEGNPLGHWEPEALVALNDKLLYEATDGWDEWQAFDLNALAADRQDYYRREISRLLTEEYASAPLFVLKDPRLCRLAPLYFDVFSELNIDVRIAVAYRDPVAVAASLHARNGYDKTTGLLFWLRHVLDAERSSRDYRRTFIEYDKLLDDWRGCLSKLQVDLGLPLNDLDAATAERIDGFCVPICAHLKRRKQARTLFPLLRNGPIKPMRSWRACQKIRTQMKLA